jgi:hypothetical protein
MTNEQIAAIYTAHVDAGCCHEEARTLTLEDTGEESCRVETVCHEAYLANAPWVAK